MERLGWRLGHLFASRRLDRHDCPASIGNFGGQDLFISYGGGGANIAVIIGGTTIQVPPGMTIPFGPSS